MVTKWPTRSASAKKHRPARAKKQATLSERLAAIGRRVPKDMRANMPADLVRNFDHYHDGSPKQG